MATSPAGTVIAYSLPVADVRAASFNVRVTPADNELSVGSVTVRLTAGLVSTLSLNSTTKVAPSHLAETTIGGIASCIMMFAFEASVITLPALSSYAPSKPSIEPASSFANDITSGVAKSTKSALEGSSSTLSATSLLTV